MNFCMSKCKLVQKWTQNNHRPKSEIQNDKTPIRETTENSGDFGFGYDVLDITLKVHTTK